MASLAEHQPVKKRKLHDLSTLTTRTITAFPLSQEEIIRRRRNKEEIRSLYDCYKRIKFCVSRKDPRLMTDLEQAYLSLISASRGCTSVQRIVAELIPRYATFCPTALEAAAKVSINMHNWSLAILKRGEDLDGTAYQTAKACIFGLVDICRTASYVAPTSSVIRGICDAVFQNVLTFFTSSFEGNKICGMKRSEILKLQEPIEDFNLVKEEWEDDCESSSNKLFKYGALCLLRIFFSFPKNLLAACFEIIATSGADVDNKQGQYFLDQVTRPLLMNLTQTNMDCEVEDEGNCVPCDAIGEHKPMPWESCFMGMVISREPTLKDWILARYKKLADSLIPHHVLEISSFLEKVFGSVQDLVNNLSYELTDEESIESFNCYAVYNKAINDDNASNLPGKEDTLKLQDTSLSKVPCVDPITSKSASYTLISQKPVHLLDAEINNPNKSLACEGEKAASVSKLESNNIDDSLPDKSMLKSLASISNDTSSIETAVVEVDNIHSSNVDSSFPPPRQSSNAQNHISSDQFIWFFDGDPDAMDVFSASKILWLGSVGCNASETSVRKQFESFGHLEQFLFLPVKNFALVEYENLADAVRAREYMQGSSQWGGFLRIKFIDIGLGSKGSVNNVAIGDSCHVYVGKVPTQQSKQEILHELMRKGLNNPHLVTDLLSEGALLLEFGTSEEAAAAMSHIRHLRKERKNDMLPNYRWACPKDTSWDTLAYHDGRQSIPEISRSVGYFPSPSNPYYTLAESDSRAPYSCYIATKPENFKLELPSPKYKVDKSELQSNWSYKGIEMVDLGSRKAKELGSITSIESSDTPTSSRTIEVGSWRPCGIMPYAHVMPPPIHSPLSIRLFYPPVNYWDNSSHNLSFSSHAPLPFIPSSVTPLSQIPAGSIQRFDHAVNSPNLPTLMPPPLMPLDALPHLSSSPPPPPLSQPPLAPPPPASPPPSSQTNCETTKFQHGKPALQRQWQGILTKSGVHYCTLYATREGSLTCKYLNAAPEPAEWPARLDVTKRTDYRHVRTTFGNTAPHRREVCRLLPSTASDHKGFNEFITYLKQRECAAVIKIPAVKAMWPRLLFILPHSLDICSMLGISPQPVECLIVLVLPKEANLDST